VKSRPSVPHGANLFILLNLNLNFGFLRHSDIARKHCDEAFAADAGLRIRIFNLAIKLISCILYVVRVALDDAGSAQDTQPKDSGLAV